MRWIAAIMWCALVGCHTATVQRGRAQAPVAVAQLPAAVESVARTADRATHRAERLASSAHGMALGQLCIRHHPDEPRCYYYRAMATGRYYEAKVIGYQKGVKQMIADLERAIALDPHYDHAGAYRMLGQLYTQLPRSTIHPGDIARDLDIARHYLAESILRAPEFPENHLSLCATLLDAEDRAAARSACTQGFRLATRWLSPGERATWAPTIAQLKKRLYKLRQSVS